MNIAVVLAGGIGARTGHCVPKQYLTVLDKPVIVYTLETLQQSRLFEEIYVVCADEWAAFVRSYAEEYHITAFKTTVRAGQTRFETLSEGVAFLNQHGKSGEDVICFVDSNRPMIPIKTYQDALAELDKCDFVFSSLPVYDSVFSVNPNTGEVTDWLNRNAIRTGQSPMVTRLKDASEAVKVSKTESVEQPLALTMLMLHKRVHTVIGVAENRKITTADDFELFRILLGAQNERKRTD